MSEELKACPFCGGEAARYLLGNYGSESIFCPDSECIGFSLRNAEYDSLEWAIEEWNKRAPNV